jgi:predicted DNA-binding transcriptional regulator AlpA
VGVGGFITEAEVACILGLSLNTVRDMRRGGHGPKFYLIGVRRLGYRLADVESWLAGRANVMPPSMSRAADEAVLAVA